MATFAFVRPDEMFGLNSDDVTGTVDDTYEATNLVDGRPSFPVRRTGGVGLWTVNGDAAEVGLVCIGHHMLDAGLVVNITGSVTTTVTIPAYGANGIPLNGVRILGAAVTGVISLTVSVAGNSGPVIIGELCAGKVRTLPRTLARDTRFTHRDFRTMRAGDMAWIPPYDKGIYNRVWSGSGLFTTTQKDEAQAWFESQRSGSKPSLIVPDTAVNDAWFVQFTGFDVTPLPGGQLWRVGLTFEEYPRSRW